MLDSEKHTEEGKESFDPRPLAMPLGYKRPEPLGEIIRRMVHNELSTSAAAQGKETFEEANDFDVDDEDANPLSHYQMKEMEEEYLKVNKPEVKKDGKKDEGTRAKVSESSQESGLPVKTIPEVSDRGAESNSEGRRIRYGRRESDRSDPAERDDRGYSGPGLQGRG